MTDASALTPDDDRYHVIGSAEHATTGMRVLKHGDTFLVMSTSGEIRRSGLGEQGLYHRGTRHLSGYRMRIWGQRLLSLSSSVAHDNLLLRIDLTNPDIHDEQGRRLIAHGALHFARSILVADGAYHERLLVTNYSGAPVRLDLELEYSADFRDIFEVRGTKRAQRGELSVPTLRGDSSEIRYRGLDGVQRISRFWFAPAPTRLEEHRATFALGLESSETQTLDLRIACVQDETRSAGQTPGAPGFDELLSSTQERLDRQVEQECHIETSNELFNEWLNRSRADLRMLCTHTPHGTYPYAGVPWFSTPFGRDGLWTALQTLWLDPSIARGVLGFLSAHQATRLDPRADSEPGKILHEMRDGEMASLGEVPFECYYGSVDSTPLFLHLAARYADVTGDTEFIEGQWPRLVLALEWLDRFGDSDGDGFIDYGTSAPDGLVQQGWKDSHDAVFHADGSPAHGPIALCEVQGYTYAAYQGMAALGDLLGHPGLARDWRQRAQELKVRFDAAFWSERLGAYVLALDGQHRPCEVMTSNAGHCLYTGIVMPHRVQPLVEGLMSEPMFSGWGVRTLAANEKRYNPISYHNGSVWPHDNAVLAAGFSISGRPDRATQLLGAMFDVSLFMDLGRLPELFCGFRRQPGLGPTRYPVACAPQAWASGAAFSLLRDALGLEIHGGADRVRFRNPVLPPFVKELRIHRLPVGSGRVDLKLVQSAGDAALTILDSSRQVEVVLVR